MEDRSVSELSVRYLLSHPIQYQVPLLRELSSSEGIDLRVTYCSRRGLDDDAGLGFGANESWDMPLLGGYDHDFLLNVAPSDTQGTLLFPCNPGIIGGVNRTETDVLWIHGYGSVTNLTAFALADALDVPTVLRAEATLPQSPSPFGLVKNAVLSRLYDTVDAFGSIGTCTDEVYETFGVPDERVFHTPYTVDNDRFQRKREDLADPGTLRKERNLPADRPVVLFVGKLIKRKRVELLLNAFLNATDPGEATLLCVGDGDRRDHLERRVARSDRSSDVRFAGFVNYPDLPPYYELADVFVLPSVVENWGLVVNEAMNFELPVVVTDAVGSGKDLVDDENGRVVPTDDQAALADALAELLASPSLRESMGSASLERIDRWGIEKTADGIVAAAKYAASQR